MALENVKNWLNDAINQLNDDKKSATMGITNLYRAAKQLDSKEDIEWCEIRLGGTEKNKDLSIIIDSLNEQHVKDKKLLSMKKLLSVTREKHIDIVLFAETGELKYLFNEGAGGTNGIQYLEYVYNQLKSKGNNGIEYRINVTHHISLIRAVGLKRANDLYDKIANEDAESTFNILKSHVDDQLLDLNADLAEKFMVAFKNAKKLDEESLSNALLDGRRLLKSLADSLYPATSQVVNGHKLTDSNYINRLAQYMSEHMSSKTQKTVDAATFELLGKTLDAINKGTNKGVHSTTGQIETIKVLLLEYIVISDLLENFRPLNNKLPSEKAKPAIQSASKKEIQDVLKISDKIANEIIKMRVQDDGLTLDSLSQIKGIGPQKIKSAKEHFEF